MAQNNWLDEGSTPVPQPTSAAADTSWLDEQSDVAQDNALVRGFKKSSQSIGITKGLLTGDSADTARKVAEATDYARKNPGTKEGAKLMDAWNRGDGVTGGVTEVAGEFAKDWRNAKGFIPGVRATAKNLQAMGSGIVEQVPNMIAPVAGMIAGGAAGSAAAGPVGSVLGGWAGASLGNTAVEGGSMVQEALQKDKIDPTDQAAVRAYLDKNGDRILGQAGVKGAIIGAADRATAGLGHFLLSGPGKAAASRALADMGVDAADKAAVRAAQSSAAFKNRIASDAAYQATQQGANKIARNAGAAALEPAGEFAGEFVGQGVATGEWDAKNAALEAASSIGQSGAMFAGQKAYQALTRPAGAAEAPAAPADAGTAALTDGQPPQPGPVLGLPAPDRGVIRVGGDGTARTPAYQAPGYVGDVTDVEPRAVNPVREQVAAAAEQGGALSPAALTAIDTGLSDAMRPAPVQAPPQISLEEADARDRAAYEQFFADFDADPVVSRYFENDDDIPDFDAASNASEEDFLRALGATDEDIQDAIATSSQSAIPQSSVASNAGPQAYEPAGPREGAGEGAASQTGQVNAGAIQQAAPDAPVPGVGGTVGADGAGSAATAVSGASGAGGAGTGAATGSGAGATEAGSARAGGRGDSNQALSAPANLRDALERVRQQKQEAANAQAAQAPAPAAAPVPGPTATAVEASGPALNIKAITAKQIPDMTDGELQQAIAHYGPEHKRTAKLQKEAQRRAAPIPTTPTTTQGNADGPQASQAQQTSPQPTQAAAPAAAAGLTNGTTTPQNLGAQAAPAGGTQGNAQTPDQIRRARLEREISTGKTNNGGVIASLRPSAIEKRKQELDAMGERGRILDAQGKAPRATAEQLTGAQERWQRMTTAERQAVAARADGLNPMQRKNVPRAAWADLSADIQRKLADAISPAADKDGEKARWIQATLDKSRLNGPTGVQIDVAPNGGIVFKGDPNSSKDARALKANYDEAIKAGATPAEIAAALMAERDANAPAIKAAAEPAQDQQAQADAKKEEKGAAQGSKGLVPVAQGGLAKRAPKIHLTSVEDLTAALGSIARKLPVEIKGTEIRQGGRAIVAMPDTPTSIDPVIAALGKALREAMAREGVTLPSNPADMTRDQFAIAYEFSGIIPQFELTSADLKDGLLGSPGGMLAVDVDKLYDKIQLEAATKAQANQPQSQSQQAQAATKNAEATTGQLMQTAKDSGKPEVPTEPDEPIMVDGLRVSPTTVKLGDSVKPMWKAQSVENAERERRGERQLGGDSLHDTKEQAVAAAKAQAQDAKDKAQASKEEAEAQKQQEQEKAAKKADTINGFTDGMAANTAALAAKALDKMVRWRDKLAAANTENANNPMFDVVTRNGGEPFASKVAAAREQKRRGLTDSHEVVEASVVSPNASGFVVKRKAVAPVNQPEAPNSGAQRAAAPQPAAAQDANVQPSPQDFIPAPDGGLDYGEITPEMGKAMRRQAGKIRLRRGDETQGLVHIENRHNKDFAALGFKSAQDFVSQVASGFTKIYKGRGAALDVVLDDQARGMLIVSLEQSGDGDFYDIKTATPIRRDQFKNEEPLWDRAGPSASTADESSPPYPKGQNGADSVPTTAPEAQAEAPKLTPTEAKSLMAWEDLGQKDGVKTHALTFYESQADKDAKRGRMIVAKVTKEVDSGNWTVEGTGEKLAVLGMAKKKAEQVGMEKAVADGFVEAAAAAPADATPEPAKPIEDAGEKIGGARKDRWKERGLNLDDLDAMTEAEGAELATKANVWKPDYEALAAQSEPVSAAMTKVIYDRLAAKPKKNTPEGRRQYVQMMRIVRDVYTEAKGPEAVKNAYLEIRKRAGLNAADPAAKSAGRELLFSVYKGRSDPFVLDGGDLMKVKKMVTDGFPAKGEPWKTRLTVGRAEGGAGTTERGIEIYMERSAEVGTPLTREQILDGFYRVSTKDNKTVAFAASKADAEAAAATVYERDMKGKKDGKPEPVRPNLDELKRENLPQRIDRDVTSEDFVRDLGFRGVEFGNWSAQDERQRILNMAYDGLMDLAEIMGVPPKAMSLNGTLGMAFGARGGGRFAAHYEPGKLVINMTKIRGGGSMAHEWAHAMDHYFGELDKPDAYTTQARGASGWYSEDQYNGVPRRRMERVGNEWKNVEKMRLDNLRPEMAAAFDEVMRALFQKQITKAEMVRSHELDLERTEALAAKEQDADMKAMYTNMAENKRQALDELRQDPEDRMYDGRGRSDYASQAQELSGKSENGYWTRPTEMFARAFESWVFDKVTAMGARSDYLVHGVEEDRFAGGGYRGNPYPTGEERARINAAFDKLASTIQTKETDKGVALFSSADSTPPAKPLSLDRVNQLVQEALAGIRGAPPVEVTARPGDIGLKVPAGSVGYGVTLRSGDIYVFQSAMGSDLDVFKTVFHELFHRGVRVLVPKGQYVQTMLDLAKGDSRIQQLAIEWKNTEMGQKQKDNLRKQGYTGAELTGQYEALAIEEALAAVAEEIKAEGRLGSKPKNMTIRFLANWLAKLADLAGMKKLAAGIRAMTYNEAERFVMSAIDRSGEPVQAGRTDNLSAKQAAPAGDQTQTEAFKRWYGDWQNTSDVPKQMEPNRDGAQASRNGGAAPIDGIQRQAGVDQDAARADGARRFTFSGASGPTGADGAPVRLYHGTKDDIAAFDLAHPRRKDKGWLGNGVYLTSNLEDANQYARAKRGDAGPNLMPLYANVRNPYEATMAEKARLKGASPQEITAFTDGLKAKGHDGVVLWDDSGHMELVAFNAADVKSAIGNRGTFDPANPDIRFRSADMGSRATDAAKAVGDTLKSITVSNVKQRAGFKLTDYLGIGLQALGRRQIVDIYGDMLPLGEYNRLVQQMEADKNEGSAEADQLVNRWAKLEDEGKLADLMHDATLAQIDPAKPYVDGDDKARYMMLQGRFNALTDAAKQVYTDTRDSYQAHHAKVRSAIKERIERSEIKGERKAALLKQMDDEFFKAIKGVYFPLARFGQYAVTVKGPDGKVESVSRAETKAEAEALRSSLLSAFPRDKGFTVGRVMLSKDFIADRDAVGRGFMTELYQVLDKQNMDAAQRAELEDTLGQLYLSSLPDLSWAKHGIHRKGTPGFSQDARRAFAQNMFHGARYLAKLRYSDLMQDELAAMQKHVDDWREVEDFDQNSAQRVVDEMNKRHESLMNPKSNPLSTALTSLGFVFHLGLSPASAMVNLSQTALVAYPIMGAKWGFGKASAALLKASAEAAKGKNDITASLNADERAAYDEAVRAGTIDVTMAHDLAGIAQGEDAGVMWKIRPVMRYASFLFHHAERFNRQVTFVAAYRLAREAGADHKAAFEQATKATYDGHFDYGAANRPRIMQGNVAKVLLLFKQYGQNMVYTLARNAQQAIKGESPEVRAQARKALGGLLATHAMAAGVLGLPMVTTLLAAASMIGGDDDEPWDAKVALQNMLADTLGQKPAEVLAHGLSRLTPWDISGRVGLDRLIFPDVQEGLEGQRLWESAATQALGPVGGIFGGALKGLDLISDGHYLLGLEAMLPAVLRQGVKSIRYATEGAQDKGGVVIKDEVSMPAVVGQLLGFSPSEVRLAQEGKSAIYQHDKALAERRQELLTKISRATMAKDEEAKAEAREEIRRFNEKNPGRRINPNHIMASVRGRQKRIDQAQDGVYLPKSRRDAMQAGRFAFADSE